MLYAGLSALNELLNKTVERLVAENSTTTVPYYLS